MSGPSTRTIVHRGVWRAMGASPRAIEGLLLLVAIIWGGSYSVAKMATEAVPVLQLLVLRFGLTFVLLLPALRGLTRPHWRQALALVSLLGINLLAIFVCETFGVSLTNASNAAFLISLCVAFTPLCEWWLLGRKPVHTVFIAALLSLVGAALLAFQHGMGSHLTWGDALMVVAAFLRGVMVCLTRKWGPRYALSALTVTAIQMGVMTVGAAVLMCAVDGMRWQPVPMTGVFWGSLFFLVVLCTLFAFGVQNYAATRASPSKVALMMGSEPLWGALIAVVWMGEQLTALGWLGGVLIVASAWWVMQMSDSSHASSVASAGHAGDAQNRRNT